LDSYFGETGNGDCKSPFLSFINTTSDGLVQTAAESPFPDDPKHNAPVSAIEQIVSNAPVRPDEMAKQTRPHPSRKLQSGTQANMLGSLAKFIG